MTHTLDEQAAFSSARSHAEQHVLVRRLVFAALAAVSTVGLLVLAGLALSAGGFDRVDLLLLALFTATTPWLVIGFWNAAIGFLIGAVASGRMIFMDVPVAATPTAFMGRGETGAGSVSRALNMSSPGLDPGLGIMRRSRNVRGPAEPGPGGPF